MTVYYNGLRQGRLLYQYSLAAKRAFYPPRLFCPYSASDQFEWRESAGQGTVYSFSRVAVRDAPSYAVALVEVDEGFRMLSKIVDTPSDAIEIGSRVKLSVGTGGQDEPTAFFTLEQTA